MINNIQKLLNKFQKIQIIKKQLVGLTCNNKQINGINTFNKIL